MSIISSVSVFWLLVIVEIYQWPAVNGGTICSVEGTCFDNIDDFAAHEAIRADRESPKQQVCYPDLGCFSLSSGELRFLNTLPASPDAINATFTLYSEKLKNGFVLNYKDPSELLRLGFLEPSKVSRGAQWLTLIVHGFASGSHAVWMSQLKDAVLEDVGGFVIILDWSKGAVMPDYVRAAANTQLVGRIAARLVHRLTSRYPRTLSMGKIHWIGHSLGAQMGHFFSRYIQVIGDRRPARITGLDAAGPEFESHGVFVNRNDADFVEGLHTSAGDSVISGELGMATPYGHVDFYPNGGKHQPGCAGLSFGCSHTRSHDLYIEARRNSASCRFTSFSCVGGLPDYLKGHCEKNLDNSSELGFRARQLTGRGVQIFETNSKSPYCEAQTSMPIKIVTGLIL